jgi:plasmid stabilization system protein ParE
MPTAVRFHPAAVRDAEDAVEWYAERSLRTAGRFLDEMDRLVELIAIAPDRFQQFDTGLRRAGFRRFPFYLVFRTVGTGTEVLAVAHGKRRPGFWRDRVAG